MIVDTSALMAVILQEEGWESIRDLLRNSPQLAVSAATYVELFVVVQRRLGVQGVSGVDRLLTGLGVQVVAFDEPQARLAREAYRRYGKGRHPAALNFGDCFSYALAQHLRQPLLFRGSDFARTDVSSAMPA